MKPPRSEPTPLREALQRQSEMHNLSPEQLKALRSLQREDAPVDIGRRRWLQGGLAAGALAATASGFLWHRARLGDPLQVLADEIAFNHLQPKPLDALGNTLDALRPAFEPLGFRLADDPRLQQIKGQLRGGRYCSVASVPAALLRYEHAGGHTTVYQARFHAQRHRGVPDIAAPDFEVCHARGVRVCLWQSQGLLFAMAFS
jgi:hypothetical protein